MTPDEIHALLVHALARRQADPYGFAFGPPRNPYGLRPWPREPLYVPTRNPPSPEAFRPRFPGGFGHSGWAYGRGRPVPMGGDPPVQGLQPWVPLRPAPVRL